MTEAFDHPEALQPADPPGRFERVLTRALTPVGVALCALGLGIGLAIGLRIAAQSGYATAIVAALAFPAIGVAMIWLDERRDR